jgi:hypothetical protein
MFTHTLTQSLQTPSGALTDSGDAYTADTITEVDATVAAYGGGANAVSIAFTAAGFQSMGLLSDVPCVITFTGATAIDGVSTSTVTLAAGVLRHVAAVTGNVTAVSVGANTAVDGLAGTANINVLFNS